MSGPQGDDGGEPADTGPEGGSSGGGKLERRLCELVVKLTELAETEGQRAVMKAMHGVVVVRMLRQAGRPVTIRDVAARTGLPAYTAEAALGWLFEEKAATRDTTGRAWLYTAVARPAKAAGGPDGAATGGEPGG